MSISVRRSLSLLSVVAALGCTSEGAKVARDSASVTAADTVPDVGPRPLGSVTIRLADGRSRRFVDHGEEETIIRHRDDGRLPRVPIHVVFREMWEAWDYVLVDLRTGDSVVVPASPDPSPTGRRLAVTSMDFQNGFAPTIVEVWRVDADSIRLEWREKTGESFPDNTGWGVSEWRWLDDSSAAIVRTVPRGEDGPHTSAPARIERRDGRWRLVTPVP